MMPSTPPSTACGYHLARIPKGELGESSKILEEVLELIDAETQDCVIMGLVELSDLIGAVNAYLAKHHPGITLADLSTMARITKRAFDNGFRT
jgi:hypothetical protein